MPYELSLHHTPLSFVALNPDDNEDNYFNSHRSVYFLKPLLWYRINYPEFGDILLFIVLFEEHPWGMKMTVFFPIMKSSVFTDWTFYVRFLGNGKMRPYTHLGGWWIMCDKHSAKVQNALINMATYGICANHKVDANYGGSLL